MNADFSHLSVAEKLQLVEDLWDNIAANPDDVPIPAWQIEELERRKANHLQNPQAGATWDEVQERIQPVKPTLGVARPDALGRA